ncbi:MAG: glycoside hydrolase family 18 protein [Deltaproteobacteria bacterium]|nr:glycoside hydrolase family 18 protein [Deltaproteobacteria bacterium]
MKSEMSRLSLRFVKLVLVCGMATLPLSGCMKNRFKCKAGNPKTTQADGNAGTAKENAHIKRSTDSNTPEESDKPAAVNDINAQQTTNKIDNSSSSKSLWTLGYYMGSQTKQYPPENINFDALTHLAVGAILPNEDGSIDTSLYQPSKTDGAQLIDQLVSLAQKKNVKTLAMLGGKGMREKLLSATSPATLSRFVAELVTYARDLHKMDGLDLAWEPFMVEDHQQFKELVAALRYEWPDVLLTFPVAPLNSNYQKADSFISAIVPRLDQINIKSYSMATAFEASELHSWHSAALKGETESTPMSVSETVNLYIKSGIPAAKIGIGIGFFGICYSAPVQAPREELRGSRIIAAEDSMSYTKIIHDYLPHSKYSYDELAEVPYLTLEPPINGCTYISFENERSIRSKAQFVKQARLGGAMIWTINQGYLPNATAGQQDPLMKTIEEQF